VRKRSFLIYKLKTQNDNWLLANLAAKAANAAMAKVDFVPVLP